MIAARKFTQANSTVDAGVALNILGCDALLLLLLIARQRGYHQHGNVGWRGARDEVLDEVRVPGRVDHRVLEVGREKHLGDGLDRQPTLALDLESVTIVREAALRMATQHSLLQYVSKNTISVEGIRAKVRPLRACSAHAVTCRRARKSNGQLRWTCRSPDAPRQQWKGAFALFWT